MRLLKKRINYQKGIGFLHLIPTEEDDFWHIYNLISVGDIIKTSTFRKVVREGQTGSKTSEKKRFVIIMKVCEINYWHEQYLLLSIKGRNVRESYYLSLGQYHTVEFDYNIPITIYKENWDKFHFKIIKEISSNTQTSDVAALVMEEGIAHLCYISTATTLLKQKLEKTVTKKKHGNEQREKSLQEFYRMCFAAIIQEQVVEKAKCLIIASPGFVKDNFLVFLKEEIQKEENKSQSKLIERIILSKCSNGYMNSLTEVLSDPNIQNQLSDTKAMGEMKVLELFFATLKGNSDKVAYGIKDVTYACSQNAISHLLISDTLQRTRDLNKRREYIKLMDYVTNNGGECFIFSSLHPSGQQLNNFTGIAAILFVPLQFQHDEDEVDEFELVELEEQKQQSNQHQLEQQQFQGEDDVDQDLLKNIDAEFNDDDFI